MHQLHQGAAVVAHGLALLLVEEGLDVAVVAWVLLDFLGMRAV